MTRFGTAAATVLAGLLAAGCQSGSSPSGSPTSTPSPTAGGASAPSPPASTSARPARPHATEFNPPGDIPDNQVFTDYGVPAGRVHIRVPEGWARSRANGVTTFTDKYNSVAITVTSRGSAPTVATARSQDVATLRATVPAFHLGTVSRIRRQHSAAVLITYLTDSAPNPVTGKVVRDAVERYEFWSAGQEAVLTLTGPQGADNVDPWRTVSDSLTWR